MDLENDYEEDFNIVLNELVLLHNYKYRDLVIYLNNYLNKHSHSNFASYIFKEYNFNDKIKIYPKIFRFNCCTYDLHILISNNPMYSLIDIFDDEDDSCLKSINSFDQEQLKMEHKTNIEKLKIIVDFLDNFSNNYIYSPYLDEFILKSEFNKKIRLENQINELCKNPINECIICYHKINDNLTTCCCNKHICRICIDKIKPLKCPNCRNQNF